MEQKKVMQNDESLKGLKGVLILVMIGLILSPIIALVNLIQISNLEDSIAELSLIDFPMIFLTVSKIGYGVLLVISLPLLFLFFKKKSIFVPAKIGQVIISLVHMIILTMIALSVPLIKGEMITRLITTGIMSALWILYFLKSKRVKNTFVE